jgi:hypothetical protein
MNTGGNDWQPNEATDVIETPEQTGRNWRGILSDVEVLHVERISLVGCSNLDIIDLYWKRAPIVTIATGKWYRTLVIILVFGWNFLNISIRLKWQRLLVELRCDFGKLVDTYAQKK